MSETTTLREAMAPMTRESKLHAVSYNGTPWDILPDGRACYPYASTPVEPDDTPSLYIHAADWQSPAAIAARAMGYDLRERYAGPTPPAPATGKEG